MQKSFHLTTMLLLTRFLGVAGHDLNFVCSEFVGALCFELDVFDEESPHVVTEAIRLEVSLVPLVQ